MVVKLGERIGLALLHGISQKAQWLLAAQVANVFVMAVLFSFFIGTLWYIGSDSFAESDYLEEKKIVLTNLFFLAFSPLTSV